MAIVLGFSGALFNGVSTTLIVPVLLNIVGQELEMKGAPPILQLILNPFNDIPEAYRLAAMAATVLLAVSLKNLTNYASTLVSSALTRSLTCDLREEGLQLLFDIDLDFYTKHRIGDVIARVGVEVNRTAAAVSIVLRLFVTSVTSLVFVGFLLLISWQLTLATAVIVVLIVWLNQYAVRRAKRYGKQLSQLSRNYSTTIFETLSGIRLVKGIASEDRAYAKLQGMIREREEAEFQSQLSSAAIGPLNEVASMLALIAIVALGRAFFSEGIATLSAVLLTYLVVLFRFLPLLSNINSARTKLANAMASVTIVQSFLKRQDKPFMPNGSIPYQGLKEEIHFERVSFGYPGTDDLVLREVDLHLPRGTTLALVGGSGAGKSTMADLLTRFYDPDEGRITFDGTDMRQFDLKTLRRAMGIVSQETFLFNDTVLNNIAYPCPGALETDVFDAAKRANAYEFIQQLPQGFNTPIGDRGVMLSGGQRQRIAIARALLQNPEILVLDEATSALDTVSERLVQEALDALSRDRTTLVIAHRLSTVQKADQIAVLDRGRVVEVGKHEELLSLNGHYAKLHSMQFSGPTQSTVLLSKTFTRISYEIRSRLNTMIGCLRLLADGGIEDVEERNELIEESYGAAVRIFNNIEMLEDSIKFQMSLRPTTNHDEESGEDARQAIVYKTSYEVRTHLNANIGILRLLSDNMADSIEEQNELVEEACSSAVALLDKLEFLEENVAA